MAKVKLTNGELATLYTLRSFDEFATTAEVASFDNRTTDAVQKQLRRLRAKGLVKAIASGFGTQRRYRWAISARGQKVI